MKYKIIAFARAMYISIIGLFIACIGCAIWIGVGFGVYRILKYFNINEPLAYSGVFLSVALPHFIYSRIRIRRGCGLSTAFAELIKRVLLIFPTMLIMLGWEYCATAVSGIMEKNDDKRDKI